MLLVVEIKINIENVGCSFGVMLYDEEKDHKL